VAASCSDSEGLNYFKMDPVLSLASRSRVTVLLRVLSRVRLTRVG
jgi:hypothetical protein